MPTGVNFDMKSSNIDGQWVMTGGQVNPNTTLIYQDGIFIEGPRLPTNKQEHCHITIDRSKIFVAAGQGYDDGDIIESGEQTLILDWNTNTWDEFEQLPNYRLEDVACGLVNNEVVVAASEESYIFSLDNLTWREGPPLPENLKGLSYTQIGNTFLAVGGFIDNDEEKNVDTIYRFDDKNYGWILEEAKLSSPRSGVAVVALPDDFVTCT